MRCISGVLDVATILWIVVPVVVADLEGIGHQSALIYVLLATLFSVLSVFWGQLSEYMDLDIRIHSAHQGYVLIQSLSQKFELLKDKPGLRMNDLTPLIGEYTDLLLRTENHASSDFQKISKGQGV